jgi:antitoxin component YwqK of YwqJK toxin-antitoxin module
MESLHYDDLTPNAEGRLCLPSGEPYTGVTEDFYENGQLQSRNEFLDGLLHGLQREWYGNGQLASEETTCLGRRHGYCREWYGNGQLKSERLFEHGFVVSRKRWDERGNLTHDSHWPYDQKYETLLKWRAEAHAAGFGPPEGVDPSLLPP